VAPVYRDRYTAIRQIGFPRSIVMSTSLFPVSFLVLFAPLIIRTISKYVPTKLPPQLPNYDAGTWGPVEADRLVQERCGSWRMNAVLLDVTGGLVAYGDWIWAVVGFLVAAIAEGVISRQPARVRKVTRRR
jgi:hypothetical protein